MLTQKHDKSIVTNYTLIVLLPELKAKGGGGVLRRVFQLFTLGCPERIFSCLRSKELKSDYFSLNISFQISNTGGFKLKPKVKLTCSAEKYKSLIFCRYHN